jgi:GT2 family glycosyltransferase
MPTPRVLISILNWNGGDSTVECLRSVFELDYPAYAVTILDNGSVDGSLGRIADAFPLATVIKSATNRGFSGGHNLVIKDGLRNDFDYFWVLNNDAVVSPQSLSQIIACMEANRQIGLASPTIYFRDQPEKILFCGSRLNFAEQSVLYPHTFDAVRRQEESAPQCMALLGTALVLRRNVAEQVGGFNEKYFAYYEDTELSFRSAKAGFLNKVVFEASVWHAQPDRRRRPPHFFYYMTRNAYWFWRFAARDSGRLEVARQHLARSLRMVAFCRDNGMDDCSRACILGFLDAIAGTSGPWDPRRLPKKVLEYAFVWHPYLTSDLVNGNIHAVIGELARRVKSQFHV